MLVALPFFFLFFLPFGIHLNRLFYTREEQKMWPRVVAAREGQSRAQTKTQQQVTDVDERGSPNSIKSQSFIRDSGRRLLSRSQTPDLSSLWERAPLFSLYFIILHFVSFLFGLSLAKASDGSSIKNPARLVLILFTWQRNRELGASQKNILNERPENVLLFRNTHSHTVDMAGCKWK